MNFKFDIVGNRKKWFLFSTIITGLGILSLLIFQMNLGVDFSSGTRLNVHLGQPYDQAKVQEVFDGIEGLNYDSIQSAGDNDMAIIQFKEVVPIDKIEEVRIAMTAAFGDQISIEESTV